MIIYNSFILSNFNYCPVIWHLLTAKMEKIQERALRFVTEDYDSPISDILVQTKSKLLHVSQLNFIANEAFKILNKDSQNTCITCYLINPLLTTLGGRTRPLFRRLTQLGIVLRAFAMRPLAFGTASQTTSDKRIHTNRSGGCSRPWMGLFAAALFVLKPIFLPVYFANHLIT